MKKVLWFVFMLFVIVTLWERHRALEITGFQKEVESAGGFLVCLALYFFLHWGEISAGLAQARQEEKEQRQREEEKQRRDADQALVNSSRAVLRRAASRPKNAGNANHRPTRKELRHDA